VFSASTGQFSAFTFLKFNKGTQFCGQDIVFQLILLQSSCFGLMISFMRSFRSAGMRKISLLDIVCMRSHLLGIIGATIPADILLFEWKSQAKLDCYSHFPAHQQSGPNHLYSAKAWSIMVRVFEVQGKILCHDNVWSIMKMFIMAHQRWLPSEVMANQELLKFWVKVINLAWLFGNLEARTIMHGA